MATYRKQYFFLFAILIGLGGVFYASYEGRMSTIKSFQDTLTDQKRAEWIYVWGQVERLRMEAKQSAVLIAEGVRTDVKAAYRTNGRSLASDLKNMNQNNHPVVNALAKNLRGVYLNGVEDDSDDPWAASRAGVASDLSVDCSAAGRSRTFEREYELHFSPTLAQMAVGKILSQDPGLIGWQFLVPEDHKTSVPTFSEANLFRVFSEQGIKGLSSFEFLSAAYIETKRDLAGIPVVDNHGTRQETGQLIIVQGFNLVRQLSATSYGLAQLNELEGQITATQIRMDGVVTVYNLLLILTLVVLVFVYLVGASVIDAGRPYKEEL